MKSKGMAKRKAESLPALKRMLKRQSPDGRTKEAYTHQPAPQPWTCSRCIAAVRVKLLAEEKGRGHANAKEKFESGFARKEWLDLHIERDHPGPPSGEQLTRNRLKRNAAFRAGVGL